MDTSDGLAHVLAGFARDVQRQPDRASVLRTVVESALRTVPGAQEGSLTLVIGRRRVLSQAASGSTCSPARPTPSTSGRSPWASWFAAHAAVACAAAQRESALERALASRGLVGQAQGILMERGRLTADQAFAALQRTSQEGNVKLAEVARRLVETGDLPAAG